MPLINLSVAIILISALFSCVSGKPHRILYDTDVDTDDFFALIYLLKVNSSEFKLEAITINGNAWTNAGHSVNHMYDILYMMGRDDIAVGVGGDGGITADGTILPNVGGYLPIVDQGTSTAGNCRYRQAIPVGKGGRLDIDTNYGVRRQFLPQGRRQYRPLRQPTVQQVLTEKVSQGPITILMSGAHTNIGVFLMSNPTLKKNIDRIYIMGGGVRSFNPTGCCPANSSSSTCRPQQCGDKGNLFSNYKNNPYAEFNFFGDPFAAYQVIHSGVPVTLVPLDATNTIPITEAFFDAFEEMRATYEAQYCYLALKITRDTWFDDKFYTSFFFWDSFMAAVAISSMRNSNGENDFAEMEFMNITVVTSNEPYGVHDGSNPSFDNRTTPRFGLKKNGIHSGHIQTDLHDPFCVAENGKPKCMDGYTKEVTSSEGVRVLVATKAKEHPNKTSSLDKAFYESFLNVLNSREQTGRFNFSTEYPYYRSLYHKPELQSGNSGKPVIIDMDMSAGDFLALFYLLKLPRDKIDLKAVLVGATGWANAATIDIVYDVLHMMGRDDVPVGLGEVFATNQSDPTTFGVGKCTYSKAIPMGSGGFLDSDTLYGRARHLPRSPRRYTAENSVKYGAPRDTDKPELRQPSALEVWESVTAALPEGEKVSVLANGPLTNLAKIMKYSVNGSLSVDEVYIVGGNVGSGNEREMNTFLDPEAAKQVFESNLKITLIPLVMQREVSSFPAVIGSLRKETPEAAFCHRLLKTLNHLHKKTPAYSHVGMLLGEVVGAVVLGGDESVIETVYEVKLLNVVAEGDEDRDGMIVEGDEGRAVRVLKGINTKHYFKVFATVMEATNQSARIGSFEQQKKLWQTPPKME